MNRRQVLAGTGAATLASVAGWIPAAPAQAIETLTVRGTYQLRAASLDLRGSS